ncbi:MAG: prephenate dehydrogenase [Chloroflexota bacterium]|nr:prephenate dehydrogenase [Chloroflexota bacterium]
MSIQIAVIGLDRVGVSAAMALSQKDKEIHCKGWDPDREKCIAAAESKVFQSVSKSLKDAVKDAMLVLISLPPQAFQEALAEMKTAGGQPAVLVNLSARQGAPGEWIEAAFGSQAAYFSMLPALGPASLDESDAEREQPRADLFQGGRIYISASPRAEEAMLNLAVDLAVLLGGQPLFAEADEVDGLAAANLLLPELAASALMAAVSSQPSWRDGGHLAGSALAQAGAFLDDLTAEHWAQVALADSANSLRVLDDLGGVLRRMRQALLENDAEALEEVLRSSQTARADWLEKRLKGVATGKQATNVPSEKDALQHFLNLNS